MCNQPFVVNITYINCVWIKKRGAKLLLFWHSAKKRKTIFFGKWSAWKADKCLFFEFVEQKWIQCWRPNRLINNPNEEGARLTVRWVQPVFWLPIRRSICLTSLSALFILRFLPTFRSRLYELFSQIDREFEALYLENYQRNLKSRH